MNRLLKYLLGTIIISTGIIYFTIPKGVKIAEFSTLIISLSLITYYFVPRFIFSVNKLNRRINLGVIFIAAMILIQLVGNISTHIIKVVFPLFDDYLLTTNIYWLVGIICFSFGFLAYINTTNVNQSTNPTFYPTKYKYIVAIFFVSFSATALAYFMIGFNPFFEGVGTGERYSNFTTTTFIIRFWSYSVVAAVLSFYYMINIKNIKLLWVILILATFSSLFFLIRMYPFLILSVNFILWLITQKSTKKIVFVVLPAVALFFIINVSFADYRSDSEPGRMEESEELNYVQSKLLYGTFNEFGSLKRAINEYDEEPQYGMTLISIPLGFIPAPFLSIFGISKSELQRNNSAAIMADFIESVTSRGIRIGIMGEFFINFKLYGCLFMFFVGLFVGYLQKKICVTRNHDWRIPFYIIFFGITLYSLIGQINAIGSLLGNYALLFIVLKGTTTRISLIS